MSSPLISIITPSYQQGHLIEATILSIRAQSYKNFEHIIIDGGSDDETIEVLRKHEGTYAMRWLSEPDQGQADAIRKGFDLAKGDLICWLNSDDVYLSPNVFSEVVAYFDAYPNMDLVTGSAMQIDIDGRWEKPLIVNHTRVNYESLKHGDSIIQPSTFWRKRIMDEIKFDISFHYAFDWVLFVEISKHFNCMPVSNMWSGYRMWGVNKTAAGGYKRTKELILVTQRYKGANSWQVWLLRFFCVIEISLSYLPVRFSVLAVGLLKLVSRLITRLSSYRVTAI